MANTGRKRKRYRHFTVARYSVKYKFNGRPVNRSSRAQEGEFLSDCDDTSTRTRPNTFVLPYQCQIAIANLPITLYYCQESRCNARRGVPREPWAWRSQLIMFKQSPYLHDYENPTPPSYRNGAIYRLNGRTEADSRCIDFARKLLIHRVWVWSIWSALMRTFVPTPLRTWDII